MADYIKIDSDQLRNHADVLRRDADAMGEYLISVYNAMKPHDPSGGGGDEVGKAIGEQYFTNATNLLHAGGVAAVILKDLAELATSGAENAAAVELYLEKLNRDLSAGDPKLPSAVGMSGDPSQSTPGQSGPSTRR